ncbi:hypothetical protein STAFG_6817 [Streptomyces afghaniensis 772]|uniref:Uncharacterized protein n=1 Tax=Streptomyces afghaniensis 772 TaxID=1283301 RepID=S4MRG5_9ACTN|nr:hypothetical protein STAFG_6817 [Streptomyces afghaniensis 772]
MLQRREYDHVADFVDPPRRGQPGKRITVESGDPGVIGLQFTVMTHTVDGIPDDPHGNLRN